MGVSTYKTANELPNEYKGLLPDAETLKKLMDIENTFPLSNNN
jgi:hypothetical protein